MSAREEYEKIISSLEDIFLKQTISDDAEFDSESQKQILERDKNYTNLLEHYVTITKSRNDAKEKYKWHYFRIIMGALIIFNILIVSTLVVLLVKCDANQLLEAVPVFVTAFAGFASSIIAIPLSITKYLFSTEEDKHITDIISHTQEHDLLSKKILKTIADTVMNKEDKSA